MTTLGWILVTGFAMSAFALVGGVALLLKEETLKKLLLPMVAFASGALLGGAMFHLLPEGVEQLGNQIEAYFWLMGGFLLFFAFEQFLEWHHCHRVTSEHRQPLTFLVLIADALHNFIGGLAVGGAFVGGVGVGLTAWVAALTHEIPQELGDFGVLVHGGWEPKKALAFNFLSALTFPLGAVLAYFASTAIDVSFLLPFAAGNFIYIAAADLIPEVRHHEDWHVNVIHLLSLTAGLGLLAGAHFVMH
ncbi:MAG: ZIP family metal transporter [Myxococcota bacterium]